MDGLGNEGCLLRKHPLRAGRRPALGLVFFVLFGMAGPSAQPGERDGWPSATQPDWVRRGGCRRQPPPS